MLRPVSKSTQCTPMIALCVRSSSPSRSCTPGSGSPESVGSPNADGVRYTAAGPNRATPAISTRRRVVSATAGRLQPLEALPDLLVGQPVVGQRVGVLGRAGPLLAVRVGRLRGRAGRIREVDTEVAVDHLEFADGVGDETEVVHVIELCRIVFGPFGIEKLQTA